MIASSGGYSREQFCGALRKQGLAIRNPCYFMEVVAMSEMLAEVVRGAEFGDQRLTQRLDLILDRLSKKPNLSIPGAMDGRAEMEGAYRFFDNAKVTPEAIMAPHVAGTHQRMRQNDTVLLVQDTTELDLTRPEQQVEGVGPLECESRVGLYYHPLMAFSPDGLSLGTVWSKSWARDEITTQVPRSEKDVQRRKTPIEEKESMRWLEGMRAARETAESCPQTQCVCVADSEADIYELFAEPRNTDCQGELHLLIRACQNRALKDQDGHILEAVRSTRCLARYTVSVSSRKPKIAIRSKNRQAARDARIAEVEVRATRLTLRPPPRPDRKLPPVAVNVVLVEEPSPPAGQTPIQWILITTLPVDSAEQALQIVDYYTIRWQIEVYFRTLKSGCRVESRYFERVSRLLNCLAVYSIAAWKILYLCRLSRECPDLSCDVVLYPSEWKAVYMAVRKKEPPETPPTLNEIVRMIASLGGYVMRKSTQPGTQTLWIGLQRLHDLETAWNTFGPPTRKN
ncbi:IS4 family transposase [Pirellulales bacterium]|nr:IS4 family transposase [Pirellulales bacterium]